MAGSTDRRVFLNCPFDSKYKPLFDAAVFTIHDLGFQARHALIDNATPVRLTRIAEEIQRAKYTVHDLSRVETSGKLKLPRFNMPFEAGMAYAMQQAARAQAAKHFLILDASPYRYQAALSDVAGLDPKIHNNDPALVVKAIRNFLVAKSGVVGVPGHTYIAKRQALFFAKLPVLAGALHISLREIKSWEYVNDLQALIVKWIGQNPP
jgi:hypothetical protein